MITNLTLPWLRLGLRLFQRGYEGQVVFREFSKSLNPRWN